MKCPGQDTRYWKPGDIFEAECPHCGSQVEFFKDEATRKCRACKKTVVNPRMNFGCASYCQYAAQCLGELGPEILAKRNDLLKDRVAIEVKNRLGKDFQRIAHVAKVARYAEEIALNEKAEPALVLCAAYLHLFFESQADGTALSEQQTARDILGRLGAGPELTEKVFDIINHFLTGESGDSINTKVFFDAHGLASLEEKHQALQGQESGAAIQEGGWLTEAGKRLASNMLSQLNKAK